MTVQRAAPHGRRARIFPARRLFGDVLLGNLREGALLNGFPFLPGFLFQRVEPFQKQAPVLGRPEPGIGQRNIPGGTESHLPSFAGLWAFVAKGPGPGVAPDGNP